jgi:adenylate cyclase
VSPEGEEKKASDGYPYPLEVFLFGEVILMAEEGFKRKLTAILSADVAGYSRLMGEDEAETVKTLNTYKEIMSTLIKQHRGRVVDSPGDNLLAEFASVVDAVQCAVSVQKELQARNADLPENRRMEFRIGINLGDVIEEENRIFGDGVNIAARLEALAEPGGICVSKTSFDHIESKLPLGYEYLGEQTVKNIPKPVGAYRVLMEPRVTVAGEPEKDKRSPVKRMSILIGIAAVIVLAVAVGIWQLYSLRPTIEPASVEKMAFPLPEKPSIAVLPFNNLSGDPTQDYIADGISENIISALSKISEMFVIARNSTFTYKGKPVKVQRVSEELGVRYVMEGSAQKIGNHIRITAQLIDAANGHHLWSEKYDRDMKDFFAIQDEITLQIIRAMRVQLTKGEQASITGKGTKNLDAYLKATQANEQFYRMNKNGSMKAKELAKEAIALDPNYAFPYASLANAHMLDVWFKFSPSPEESMRLAAQAAQKALDLDDSDPRVYSALNNLYIMQRQYEKAIAAAERQLELSPSGARSYRGMAVVLRFLGRYSEAIPFAEQAIRLDPYPPAIAFRHLGDCYRNAGRYEEATTAFKKALQKNPDDIFTHIGLAITYVKMGREEEARAEAKEVIRIHPKFSIAQYTKGEHIKHLPKVDEYIESMRKAGLPD